MVRPGRRRRGALRREDHGLGTMVRLALRRGHTGLPSGSLVSQGHRIPALNVMLATVNGAFHYRLLTNRTVTWRWMFGLSAMDIVLITANIAVSGRFDNYIFITYYPALGAFAVIFTSFRLNMAWVTATAAANSAVSFAVGAGLDLDAGDERALAARVAGMYLIVVGINLISDSISRYSVRVTSSTAASTCRRSGCPEPARPTRCVP